MNAFEEALRHVLSSTESPNAGVDITSEESAHLNQLGAQLSPHERYLLRAVAAAVQGLSPEGIVPQ